MRSRLISCRPGRKRLPQLGNRLRERGNRTEPTGGSVSSLPESKDKPGFWMGSLQELPVFPPKKSITPWAHAGNTSQNDGLPLLKLGLLLLTGSGSPSTANLDFKNQVLRPCAVRTLPKARVCVGPTRGKPRSACHTFHHLSLGKLASLKKEKGGTLETPLPAAAGPPRTPSPSGSPRQQEAGSHGRAPRSRLPRSCSFSACLDYTNPNSQPAWTTQIRVLQ